MRTITELYTVLFTPAMQDLALVAPLAKKFRLDVIIRRAIINEAGGFIELRLTGSPEEIGRAIADLQTTGAMITGPLVDTGSDGDELDPRPTYVGRGT